MGMAQIVCTDPQYLIANIAAAPPTFFGILGWNWISLTMLALLVSLLMLALANIFANFLRNQQLIVWTKFELFQVIGTAAIFAFMGIIVVGMCTFDMSFLGTNMSPNPYIDQAGKGMNMYEIVDGYFAQLQTIGGLIFAYLMWIIKIINLLAKITWLSNPLGLGMQDSPLESLGQINSIFFFVVGGFFTSLLMMALQMKILNYMSYAIIFYLFPFGIFFRAFEPTRKFGGTLIGLSISFFLFYPILLVFNAFIMNAPLEAVKTDMEDAALAASAHVDNGDMPDGENVLKEYMFNSTADAGAFAIALGAYNQREGTDMHLVLDEGQMMELQAPNAKIVVEASNPDTPVQIENEGGLLKAYMDAQPTPKDGENIAAGISNGAVFLLKPVMFYVVAAVILPIINFIVLVEITRTFTHMFGEEIDVSNLTRMI